MLDLRHTRTRMATSMDADSEVLFKEKREEKGVKAETAADDATIPILEHRPRPHHPRDEEQRPEEGTVRCNVGLN